MPCFFRAALAGGRPGRRRNWFDKEWDQLSLSENAFLAGVLQAPSALDPRRNPERAVARRNHVLNRMEQVGLHHR